MAKKLKFEFGTDFQQLILQHIVTDKTAGPKIIKLLDDTYFTLIHHAVIAFLLKSFYKKRKRLPTEPILKEDFRTFFQKGKIKYPISDDDKVLISQTIKDIYSKPVGDGDVIMAKCINFARFIAFKNELENVNLNDYESYETYADKLKKAQNIGENENEDNGVFLVSGMQDRAHNRDIDSTTCNTPFWQFNRLLNGSGTMRGNIIMLMSQAKRFKTGALINTALGYMKRRKKVLYIDLENGEKAITTRSEQSLIEEIQDDVLDGKFDKKLLKLLRRYRRVGSEMVIKRFPAYVTTCNNIQGFIDNIRLKFGIVFDVLIVDYPDLLGSLSGNKDETGRINDAWVDLKNLSETNQFEATWVASHVKREASKRRDTKYEQNDVAKCVDKIRHADAIIGIQENEEEIANGVQRWEIIDQRNGKQFGEIMFWVDISKQKMREFTKAELKDYLEQLGKSTHDLEEKQDIKKPKRKNDL